MSTNHRAEDLLPKEEIERRIELLRAQTFYKGKSNFPERETKSENERFKDLERQIRIYGYPDFQYMLYGMDVKNQEEQDTYVNGWEFVCRRNYLNSLRNSHNSTCILRNKFYFGIFAKAIGLKTPGNVAYIENGVIHDVNNQFSRISFRQLMELSPDSFCKELDGENGVSVFHVENKDGILHCNGKPVSENDFMNQVSKGSYLVQKRIEQHDILNTIYPLSINTMRIVTVRSLKTGKISVWPSILRVGAYGNHIDNSSQGGLAINLNTDDGTLCKYGFRWWKFGGRFTEHPDTKVVFDGFKLPFVEEAKRAALYFHSMLKDIHSIGWDIVITPEGPAFIEGNDDWEIPQSQMECGIRERFLDEFYE